MRARLPLARLGAGTSELNRDVALLKAGQATVRDTGEMVSEREAVDAKHDLFGRAFRWLAP